MKASRAISTVKQKICFAHSSWFRIKEQGMEKHEVLARGSGFFVRRDDGRYAAFFAAHVSAPYRWRQYFQQEWLEFVGDQHCVNRIELQNGTIDVHSNDIVTIAQVDAAATLVGDESSELLAASGVAALSLEEEIVNDVILAGYELAEDTCGTDSEEIAMTHLKGSVVDFPESQRIFVRTDERNSEFGMCGGPAVQAKYPTRCLGLLEGRVPDGDEHSQHPRAGQSALVPASTLARLLNAL